MLKVKTLSALQPKEQDINLPLMSMFNIKKIVKHETNLGESVACFISGLRGHIESTYECKLKWLIGAKQA